MKLYELIKRIPYDQDEITIVFSNDNNVMSVYGYDANGYDGIMISIVEE